jgi:DnaJ-class molecular chaperone
MSWQKCPVCNGTGEDAMQCEGGRQRYCKTCKGARIINEITGLPPQKPTATNFGSTRSIRREEYPT